MPKDIENLDEVLKIMDEAIETTAEVYGEQICERMVQNIQDNIEFEIYETFLKTKIEGIIDFGDYLRSIDKDVEGSPDLFIVGSTDAKSKEIEFGRPPNAREPKDSDIIAWVRRKGIAGRSFIRVGQRIARYIRRHGIKEKPAFRMAIDRTKGDNEEIKNRTIEILNDRLKI